MHFTQNIHFVSLDVFPINFHPPSFFLSLTSLPLPLPISHFFSHLGAQRAERFCPQTLGERFNTTNDIIKSNCYKTCFRYSMAVYLISFDSAVHSHVNNLISMTPEGKRIQQSRQLASCISHSTVLYNEY